MILFSIFKTLQCRRLSIHKNLAAAFIFRFTLLAIWSILQVTDFFADCTQLFAKKPGIYVSFISLITVEWFLGKIFKIIFKSKLWFPIIEIGTYKNTNFGKTRFTSFCSNFEDRVWGTGKMLRNRFWTKRVILFSKNP